MGLGIGTLLARCGYGGTPTRRGAKFIPSLALGRVEIGGGNDVSPWLRRTRLCGCCWGSAWLCSGLGGGPLELLGLLRLLLLGGASLLLGSFPSASFAFVGLHHHQLRLQSNAIDRHVKPRLWLHFRPQDGIDPHANNRCDLVLP